MEAHSFETFELLQLQACSQLLSVVWATNNNDRWLWVSDQEKGFTVKAQLCLRLILSLERLASKAFDLENKVLQFTNVNEKYLETYKLAYQLLNLVLVIKKFVHATRVTHMVLMLVLQYTTGI